MTLIYVCFCFIFSVSSVRSVMSVSTLYIMYRKNRPRFILYMARLACMHLPALLTLSGFPSLRNSPRKIDRNVAYLKGGTLCLEG